MTTATATTDKAEATVLAEYGDLWRLYSSGAVQRADTLVAVYHRDTATLAWESMEASRQYRVPVGRLLTNGQFRPENMIVKDAPAQVVAPDAPPRPAKHIDYGEYTPSLVRWRWKYAKHEFQLFYGPTSMDMVKDGVEMDVLRKDIYPDYQSRWNEDQPTERKVTWIKPGGTQETLVFERHRKGDAIPPHFWRCYGEEVIERVLKLPATCDTVMTYKAVGAEGEQDSHDVPANLKYE